MKLVTTGFMVGSGSRDVEVMIAVTTFVIPEHAGIQYAAALRFNHRCLWNTGSSVFADDDSGKHSRGAVRPEFCISLFLIKIEGAGKTGCALDASTAASGPHDFTVRNDSVRLHRHRVHRYPRGQL